MGVLSVRQIVSHEWSLTGCLDSVSTIAHFVTSVTSLATLPTPQTENIHRIVLPFKDQRSADMVKKHLSDLRWLTTVFPRLSSARYDSLPHVSFNCRACKNDESNLKK